MMPRPVIATLSLLLGVQLSSAFSSPRIGFDSSSVKVIFSSDQPPDEPLLNGGPEELGQFEKDLLAAFGNEDQDDAVTNAAYAAFARDLQNVDEIDEWGKWSDDVSEDDFLISEQVAFELYTETIGDMTSLSIGEMGSDLFNVEVPEDERQLVEDMIASANRAIETIWGEQGMSNPVRDYFNDVKKAGQDLNEVESESA
jgi:hypothetical protein